MSKLNWDKLRQKSTLYKQKTALQKQKEEIKLKKIADNDILPATEKQKEYIKNILRCDDNYLQGITINKARRIIGEYELDAPATEKQKNIIIKNKFVLQSKIESLSIKEAKQIIENGRKILEKKKKIEEHKRKLAKFRKTRKRK